MGAQADNKEKTPSYQRWTTIVASVVGALSLLLNAVQASYNTRLAQAKSNIEQRLASQTEELNKIKIASDNVELELKRLKAENDRLELQTKKRQVRVDLDAGYPFIFGRGIFNLADPEKSIGLVKNSVWQNLQSWVEKWESGSDLLDDSGGVKRVHGVLLFRVRNRGQQDARNVFVTIRSKKYPASGYEAEQLWELDRSSWSVTKVSLKDLSPGQSKLIPLAHVLGTRKYYGEVFIPEQLEWDNPTTSEHESIKAPSIVSSDQWQIEGATIQLAQ